VYLVAAAMYRVIGKSIPAYVPTALWRVVLRALIGAYQLKEDACRLISQTDDFHEIDLETAIKLQTKMHQQKSRVEEVGNILQEIIDLLYLQIGLIEKDATEIVAELAKTPQILQDILHLPDVRSRPSYYRHLENATRSWTAELTAEQQAYTRKVSQMQESIVMWECASTTASVAATKARNMSRLSEEGHASVVRRLRAELEREDEALRQKEEETSRMRAKLDMKLAELDKHKLDKHKRELQQ